MYNQPRINQKLAEFSEKRIVNKIDLKKLDVFALIRTTSLTTNTGNNQSGLAKKSSSILDLETLEPHNFLWQITQLLVGWGDNFDFQKVSMVYDGLR